MQPLVADEDRPPESPIFKLFTAKGPAVPLGTWVPGHHYRDKWQPASVGLQHAGGRHAAKLLEERGVAEPDGWNRRQDHIKRGLVYELPEGQDPRVALEFLVDAMANLVEFPAQRALAGDGSDPALNLILFSTESVGGVLLELALGYFAP